jgi:hypothetical protein
MRSRWLVRKLVVTLIMVGMLFGVAACQQDEEVDEAEPNVEAEVETVSQPTSAPVPTEPTVEEPTEEPTEEATIAAEPTPSPEPETQIGEMEVYDSVTEFFSLMVPAGWTSEETFPGGAFVMANSAGAFDRFNNDGAIESGDLILNVGFLPYELFRQREVVPLDIQFEATPDIFLQSLLPMFRIADSAAVSDPELVSLSEGREAGMLTVSDEGREGMILMFAAGEEVVAFVSAVGFPGELDAFREVTYAVAAEVAFGGAQGALYGTLLGG